MLVDFIVFFFKLFNNAKWNEYLPMLEKGHSLKIRGKTHLLKPSLYNSVMTLDNCMYFFSVFSFWHLYYMIFIMHVKFFFLILLPSSSCFSHTAIIFIIIIFKTA